MQANATQNVTLNRPAANEALKEPPLKGHCGGIAAAKAPPSVKMMILHAQAWPWDPLTGERAV